MNRISIKAVAAGMLLVALFLAGVVSFYADSDPDGLESVAEDKGFLATASDHAAGEGPFADYASSFIDNERLSGGVAGVVGVVVVLAVTGVLVAVLRRRNRDGVPADEAA